MFAITLGHTTFFQGREYWDRICGSPEMRSETFSESKEIMDQEWSHKTACWSQLVRSSCTNRQGTTSDQLARRQENGMLGLSLPVSVTISLRHSVSHIQDNP